MREINPTMARAILEWLDREASAKKTKSKARTHEGLWLKGYVLLVGKRGRVGKYEYVARPGRETARAFSVVVEEHMPSLGDDTLVGSTEVFLPKSHARVHGRRVFVPEWLVRKSFALKDLQEAGLLLRAYVRSQKALRSDAAWDEFWHSVRGHELEWAERVLKKGVVRNGRVVLDIDRAGAKTSKKRSKTKRKKTTLAEVRAAHRKRSRRARTQDERKRAKSVLPPEKYHLWLRHPGRYDVRGVDTPKKR